MKRLVLLVLLIVGLGCEAIDAKPTDEVDLNYYRGVIAIAAASIDVVPDPNPGPGPKPPSDVCPHCDGLGYVGDGTLRVKCQPCDGTGRLKRGGMLFLPNLHRGPPGHDQKAYVRRQLSLSDNVSSTPQVESLPGEVSLQDLPAYAPSAEDVDDSSRKEPLKIAQSESDEVPEDATGSLSSEPSGSVDPSGSSEIAQQGPKEIDGRLNMNQRPVFPLENRVVLLTTRGWGDPPDDNIQGNFAHDALKNLEKLNKGWKIGDTQDCHFQVLEVDTDDGRLADEEYARYLPPDVGRVGSTATERLGHPVWVEIRGGEPTKLEQGFRCGDPFSMSAAWYLAGKLGVTPESQVADALEQNGKIRNRKLKDFGQALSRHVTETSRGGPSHSFSTDLKIADIIDALTTHGRRQLTDKLSVDVPQTFRMKRDQSKPGVHLEITEGRPKVTYDTVIDIQTDISHIWFNDELTLARIGLVNLPDFHVNIAWNGKASTGGVGSRQPDSTSQLDEQRGRNRVIVITSCGIDEVDSDCFHCDREAIALRRLRVSSRGLTVGKHESNDFQVFDIDTAEGRSADRKYGRSGRSLTDEHGRPVNLVVEGDRVKKVIPGWNGGNPKSDEALDYLESLLSL